MLSSSLEDFHFSDFERFGAEVVQQRGDFATKAPMDVFQLSRIAELNAYRKDLCIIICVRDVRDIVTSRHPLLPDRYFIGYDFSWWPQNVEKTQWQYDGPGIGAISHAIDEAARVPGIRSRLLRYESLVADADALQSELATWLGVEFQTPFSQYYRYPKRLAYRYEDRHRARDEALVREDKPVDPTRVQKWRSPEHRERIREQFTQFPDLFRILKLYGYESDDRWFETFTWAGSGPEAISAEPF
jgi:hypothetical protein